MKKILFILLLSAFIFSSSNVVPLSQRGMNRNVESHYGRGIFLIVVPQDELIDRLSNDPAGDFIHFKKTQGFDVEVMSIEGLGLDAEGLRNQIEAYKLNNPMLEYVLLIGDVNWNYEIPTFTIPSINEEDIDVTDYKYTFFVDDENSDEYDAFSPEIFVGRWSIQTNADLSNLISRSIKYVTLEYIKNTPFIDYLDRALLVAGSYATYDGNPVPPVQWPVTPVWTSMWLYDELEEYGYNQIDTAFYHAGNYQNGESNPLVASSWNSGVGIINYRGWGDANGWHKPYFHRENVNNLTNGWMLPIVMSFVCNTGDFGNDYSGSGLDKCYGEAMVTYGSLNIPKGAAAMVGPSDLDTDTRFNNVICGAMWDALLEDGVHELAPALHAGKQSLITEFPDQIGQLDPNGKPGVVYFYHHVYSVMGDPSIPVWLGVPEEMNASLESGAELNNSHISLTITDQHNNPLEMVVGALMVGDDLVGKGLSNENGNLYIDFSNVELGSELELYLNKSQFYQQKITLNFSSDNGETYNPEVFTYFDIDVITGEGMNYVTPGNNLDLSLNISNSSQQNYSDLALQFVNFSEGIFNASPNPANTFEINGFDNQLLNSILTGDIDVSIPIGTQLFIDVDITQNGDVVQSKRVNLMVPALLESDPTPPDNYGYWGYDNWDTNYAEAPTYNWVEISPSHGGMGTDLNLVDDTRTTIPLGFNFQYYGKTYNEITVCSNGWTSFEPTTISHFWNFSIPMPMGPAGMIAPFMDDLDDNVGTEPFEVLSYYDEDNGQFIIQWENVANGENDEYCPDACDRESFQMILFNTQQNPTITGDGEILFQYKEINDVDQNGNYSTIGIESPDQNQGVQYCFNNTPGAGASLIQNNMAIKFTTDAPSGYLSNSGLATLPDGFTLSSAYPNPFNPTINIPFDLKIVDRISISVFDIKGQLIEEITNKIFNSGHHNVIWNAEESPSGIYFIQLENSSHEILNTKVTLVK
ncbi:MAG: T9SS type A sorting domain-containing protein [Candidatus Marinimicrobia bacterium]|nr:T9SS type A sorting domain-containing protein [Candidatus Neomarinimicrobiota bacterium]